MNGGDVGHEHVAGLFRRRADKYVREYECGSVLGVAFY